MKSVWLPLILEALSGNMNTSRSIVEGIGINRNTFYYHMRRQKELGNIEVDRSGNVNFYKLLNQYREFRYGIHIIDTFTKKPKHRWDCDAEIVMSGIVPVSMTEQDIKDHFEDELQNKGHEILQDEGILNIPTSRIQFSDLFSVSGVEMGDLVSNYNSKNDIEIKFVNNVNHVYFFNGYIQTKLSDFT